MANQNNLKISGMLNQHEFKERYNFTVQRIINGFSRPGLAFLLGKTTYEVSDYEHLCEHIRMSYKDHEVMAALFGKPAPSVPAFQIKANDIDISGEKRMIRGEVIETESERQFHFVHPWKIKGENTAFKITENLSREADQDIKINLFVNESLNNLIITGCFNQGCTALFLYEHLNSIIAEEWRPLFLKNLSGLVYARIHTGEFHIHRHDGQVLYKIKR
jgi:hypothetical protein